MCVADLHNVSLSCNQVFIQFKRLAKVGCVNIRDSDLCRSNNNIICDVHRHQQVQVVPTNISFFKCG